MVVDMVASTVIHPFAFQFLGDLLSANLQGFMANLEGFMTENQAKDINQIGSQSHFLPPSLGSP